MKTFILLPLFLLVGYTALGQSVITTTKCKTTASERVRRDCIVKEVQAYAQENFDVAAVANYAKIGPNKIYAQFKVDQNAVITEVRTKATSPELEFEAVKVINSFPNLIVNEETDIVSDKEFETFNLIIVFTIDDNIANLTASQITGTNE